MKILLTHSQTGPLLLWAAAYNETLTGQRLRLNYSWVFDPKRDICINNAPHIPVQGPGKMRRECEGQRMGRRTVAQVSCSLTPTASESSLSTCRPSAG